MEDKQTNTKRQKLTSLAKIIIFFCPTYTLYTSGAQTTKGHKQNSQTLGGHKTVKIKITHGFINKVDIALKHTENV